MTFRIVVVAALLAVISSPAFALPDYSVFRRYYDAQGNEVGSSYLYCNGQIVRTGTTTSDKYCDEYAWCPGTLEPISCESVDLESTGCPDYCVTSGYRLSVEIGTIDDPCIP